MSCFIITKPKIIRPIKSNKRVINSKDCIGCSFRSGSNRINNNCKSCGNWDNKL